MTDPLAHPATTDPESRDYLFRLVSNRKPDRILEIGTAFGVTTEIMHAAYPGAIIHTLEIDHDMLLQARQRLKIYPEIHQYLTDSQTWDPPFNYDFIYIDGGEKTRAADLGRYLKYLNAGGLIAIHDMTPNNTLFNEVINVIAANKLSGDPVGRLMLVQR